MINRAEKLMKNAISEVEKANIIKLPPGLLEKDPELAIDFLVENTNRDRAGNIIDQVKSIINNLNVDFRKRIDIRQYFEKKILEEITETENKITSSKEESKTEEYKNKLEGLHKIATAFTIESPEITEE